MSVPKTTKPSPILPRICGVILSGILAAAPLLTNVSAKETHYFPDIEHNMVHYEEMDYQPGYSTQEFMRKLQTWKELAQSPGNEKKLQVQYEELIREVNYMSTNCTLSDVRYYRDVQNEEQQGINSRLMLDRGKAMDAFFSAIGNVLDTDYYDSFSQYIGKDLAEGLLHYKEDTPEQVALWEKNTQLTQKYESLATQEYKDTKAANEILGAVYIEMVQLRTEIAKSYDFDNFADYASYSVYYRDFGPREKAALYKNVKRFITPASILISRSVNNNLSDRMPQMDIPEIMEQVSPHLGTLSSELEESWNNLVEYGLYDVDDSSTKSDTAFTSSLESYNTAFIFIKPYNETFSDFTTLIHEFGHFNYDFHSGAELFDVTPMDLMEIHSTGLELLYTQFYPDIFGDLAEEATAVAISDTLSSIEFAAMLSEFEDEVYANPDMSLEELNALYGRIMEEYQYVLAGEHDQNERWVYFSHLYSSPGYVLSYAVSGMAALDTWLQGVENPDKAVDNYLKLVSESNNGYFQETLKKCGYDDIFSARFADKLSAQLLQHMGLENPNLSPSVNWVLLLLAVVLSMVVVIVFVFVYVRKQRKNIEIPQDHFPPH